MKNQLEKNSIILRRPNTPNELKIGNSLNIERNIYKINEVIPNNNKSKEIINEKKFVK